MTKEQLIEKYASEIEDFKKFCDGLAADDRTFEEIDFNDLSIGFFIAKGITGDTIYPGEPFSDAFVLATYVRYECEYWF